MFKSSKVIFEKGKILNSKMLEEIQNYTERILNIDYYNYSNGIIKGLEFFYDKNQNLFITPGILKKNNKLYFLEEELLILKECDLVNFLLDEKERKIYISLKEENKIVENNIILNFLKVEFSEVINDENTYLGSYIKRKNLLPKIDYKNFEDFGNSAFVDIRHRKYAALKRSSISPLIINKLSNVLLCLSLPSALENYIIAKGLDNEVVSLDILEKYLGKYFDENNQLQVIEEIQKKLNNKNIKKEKKIESKAIDNKEFKQGLERE